jgi:polyisoprenoid-binding protein YceI|tara:strand:+ start:654 stop:1247 length:594 start_codon:yes stop_codon:yes gene_type:complete
MKNLFIPVLLVAAFLISSFTISPHTNDVKVNTKNSKLIWTGSKPTGSHTGTIDIVSGFLTFDHGNFVGGTFSIDMQSLATNDMSEESNKKLDRHLKNEDFFDVEKFSDANLKITKVFKIDDRNYSVLADLTMKGITNPISFEAEVTGSGNSFVAAAKFTIDRTKWGVEYKSGNIFKNLGDKIIYDDIELDVFLISNK